jgi:hydroxypyruvate reductase/glycerate 2-kinase
MDDIPIIKNRDELDTSLLRTQALDIIEAGISRVLPPEIMRSALRYGKITDILTINGDSYNLKEGRLFVVGGGKASGLMAEVLESIIPADRITAGIINCKKGSGSYSTEKIEIIEAGHPVPDSNGINGVNKMLALKDKYTVNANDLVLCLISGGGSALMPCPVDGITLEDKQLVTGLLLECGAEIHEINTVRKHLSKIKGGGLGKYFEPARVVSLIISDVIGNNLDVIASGPTSPDSSTFDDTYSVLEKYDLFSKIPGSVLEYLDLGRKGQVPETPKTLENCWNYIIGDNILALEAMAEKARSLGLKAYIVTSEQKGDTSTAARMRAEEIIGGKYSEYNVVILGGETTPALPEDHGKGGRNQHYAAVSMQAMKKYPGEWVAASAGTDGSDYLPDVAGALVDNRSLEMAIKQRIDVPYHIDRFDSNTLFSEIGSSLIITGSTGTNVGDIIVYILKK